MPYLIVLNTIFFVCLLKFDISAILHPIPLFILAIITILYFVCTVFHAVNFLSLKLSSVFTSLANPKLSKEDFDKCNDILEDSFNNFNISLRLTAGIGLLTAMYGYALTINIIQSMIPITN